MNAEQREAQTRSLALRSTAAIAAVCIALGVVPTRAFGNASIINDPDRLEMILLARPLEVTIANPEPIRTCACCDPIEAGSRCRLPAGVGLRVRGTDKRHVLLEYQAWTDRSDATCPRGTLVLMTRQEFRTRTSTLASRRMPVGRLTATVKAILERPRRAR